MSEMVFSHHPRKLGVKDPKFGGEMMLPNEDWTFDPTTTYSQDVTRPSGMKPHGFWLSVDDDWKRWCDDDSGWELTPPHLFGVDMERVLHLETSGDILDFTRAYGIYEDRVSGAPYVYKIRWDVVAEQYAGIVIAPYCWPMRLDMECGWYYCWDCASGCIWDLSVLTLVEAEEKAS